ncbi:Methyltransferase type 12 [Burkholderia sp. BT03]|nr:Methyltransferase type 12 [Burkholderia sp. BT03]
MSQVTTGIRSILSSAGAYNLVQTLMGAHKGRTYFANTHIRANAGARVLDIGCGTSEILGYLPKVDYVGVDISPDYIAAAKSKYGNRGVFHSKLLTESEVDAMQRFDIVLAIGLLHHMDDDAACNFIALARRALAPGGRLVTIDGCFVKGQNPIARFIISRDRGQNIRTPEGYASLASSNFTSINTTLRHVPWIPYTHWIMECNNTDR